MKMKKPSSMTTVLSRTCPLCFTMVDPVWYGWHISKCTAYNSQDMALSTILMKKEAHNSQLVVATCEEGSASLPEACTISLAPDSQFVDENSREENPKRNPEVNEHGLIHLRTEKQALSDKIKDLELQLEKLECQLNAEKQALADKVKCLELNVEELECQLRLSKESERKALCLVESLQGSGKEYGLINGASQCNELLEITTLEPKTLSSDKQSMEFGNDGILPCDKQGKEVDEHSDHSKDKAVGSISTKNADSREEIELDCVVGLACTGGLISNDFLIQVDGFIESHKAFSSTRNTSVQDIPLEPSVNAKNGDPFQDILAKIDSQDSTKQHNGLFATSHNGSPSTVVADEEHHTAPRGTLRTPFNFSNESSLNSYQADGHGVEKLNGGSVVQTKDCGPHLDGKGAAIEILFHGLDKDKSTEEALCEQKSHAMEAHSFSSSSSSELEVHVVKAKAGVRRIVLSDSESEDGDMQGNCKGGNCQDTHTGIRTNLCNSKESCLPFTGTISMDEQRHDSSVEFRARDTCASNGVENRVSQQSLPRRKQLKVVQSSDPLDDVACKEVSEHSSPRSAEGPKALAINLEGAGVGGIEDGEPTGVRRSKRLRSLSLLKSQSKDPGIPSSKKKIRRMVVASPNSTETNGSLQGSKESNSEAAADTHSNTVDNTLEAQGLPSSKKIFRRRVEVSSSSSAGTSGHVEGLLHKRSKRPPRVLRRLFEEVESKPAYGDNHPMDSEDDDSEIESDADSLKDFIVDSEDAEDSRSSNDEQASSGSHSSRDAFFISRLGRDIKIRHYVWELEPEMLAALAVNPELCLRAVCAINRRQTEDEQKEKMSKYLNKRGFDKLHAKRGTRIAEFLTDGDPEGPVKKSEEDLNKFDAGGVEFCKMIAAMHSKQLFEIYTNTEDPHFPFS